MDRDALTVDVSVERLPVWQWPLSVPRGWRRRWRFMHEHSGTRYPWSTLLMAVAFLGTRRLRINGKVAL